MSTSEIKGKQIRDETVTAADLGPDSVSSSEIAKGAVEGHAEKNPAVSGDFILISDSEASGALKKVQVGNLGLAGGSQNLFSTFAVSGQSNIVADSTTDTLTFVAGSNITLTTNANSDSITIAASDGDSDIIEDADHNTKIEVEANADENKIRFTTNGAERMIIDENGKVGIGITNPDTFLHIKGSAPGITLQRENNSNEASDINFEGQAGIVACKISQVTGSDNELAFYTHNGSNLLERIRIDNNGKVGIGTGSPDEALTINGTEPAIQFQEGEENRAKIWINDSDNLKIRNQISNRHTVFEVNDGGTIREALRIRATADGISHPEVVVNEGSESLMDFRVESNNKTRMLLIDGDSDTVVMGANSVPSSWDAPPVASDVCHFQGAKVIFGTNSNDSDGGVIAFNKSRNATEGAHTVVQTNDCLGGFDWMGSDGSNFEQAASISAFIDKEPFSGGDTTDMPGRLVFSTTADGTNTSVERMRIDSSGQIGIGLNNPSSMVHIGGSQAGAYQSYNSGNSINLDGSHYIVDWKGTSNTYTVNLPDPSTCTGRSYHILNSSSSNQSDVTASTSNGNFLGAHIEGNNVTSVILEDGGFQSISIISTGSDWFVIHDGRLTEPPP